MISDTPSPATGIASFGGAEPEPHVSRLNYSVPLPGRLASRRVVELADLAVLDEFHHDAGPDVPARIGGMWSDGRYLFRPAAAVQTWLRIAAVNGVRGDLTSELSRFLTAPAAPLPERDGAPAPVRAVPGSARTVLAVARSHELVNAIPSDVFDAFDALIDLDGDPAAGSVAVPELFGVLASFLSTLHRTGMFEIPSGNPDGGVDVHPVLLEHDPARLPADPDPPQPRLFLIEEWTLSSFLGDYGLGRTIKTLTLLPGEELTLRLRTWRSSERSVRESSSIFDSNSREAQQRFTTEVERETTDKQARTRTEEWHAEAKAGGSWGFASAEVSGGGSGRYHSAREQFARQVNGAAQEHARSESGKRENTVTSSTEVIEKSEDEESSERVIRNVNLRHTLNFVFRELNQVYETYLHLTNLKVGFTAGTVDSWREVPISQVGELVEQVVVPAAAPRVTNAILNVACRAFDTDGNPVPVLEHREWNESAGTWSAPVDARPVDGVLPAPSDVVHYRVRQGPLGRVGGEPNTRVPGVVLHRDAVTMTTDSIVGEALLGQGDALDVYAMATQAADAAAKTLANERTAIVNTALAGLPGVDVVDASVRLAASGSAARLDIRQVAP